jgi:CPA1 family monovalent cation:H+ antiporter
MNTETTFIVLFIVAMVVAIGVRHLRLPYTVGLVLAGLFLGWAHLLPAPEFNKTLLFSIFLPGLIFEAAFHIDFQEFWRNRITMTSLAVPGVVASMVLTAVALAPLAHALGVLPGFTWRHALVFGALISATDPVAVLALFRRFGIPRRLAVLVEGESLLNDGTGIVFFTLSLSIFAGAAITAQALALEFVTVVGMGAIIGIAVGMAASLVMRNIDDSMVEVSVTTIAAYGSFLAADHLAYSGVIATVAAGLVCGNYGARTGMSPSTRVAAETFWEYIAFALNSVIFLLIGIEVPVRDLLTSWLQIIAAYLIVTVARAVIVDIVWRFVRLTRERFSWRWSIVLTWGGLRGALPMVLALGLPPEFPFREEIITMTFGVVTLSILGHGLTMSLLLRRLGIVRADTGREAYDLLRGELQAALAGLEEIAGLERLHSLAPESIQRLKAEYQQRVERARGEMAKLTIEQGHLDEQELFQARQHLLLVERNRIVDAYKQGLLLADVHDRLLADIDARILELESSDAGTAEAEEREGAGPARPTATPELPAGRGGAAGPSAGSASLPGNPKSME